MNDTDCRDCILGREQYEVQWCPVHYDRDRDNAKSLEQTGLPLGETV